MGFSGPRNCLPPALEVSVGMADSCGVAHRSLCRLRMRGVSARDALESLCRLKGSNRPVTLLDPHRAELGIPNFSSYGHVTK